MQAVRQCSVCASRAAGGFLRNQTDISLLRTSRPALRRGTACIRALSSSDSDLFSSRKAGVQKSGKWTDTVHMSIASLSVTHGLCAVPFTQQVESLSHDSLIRRAASVVTDSSSTFLSQTTLALIDALTDYSKVSDRLDECKRFESSWINAVNLCKMAAEAAYTSGAEHASNTVRTNIQVAQSQVEEARKLSVGADKKLAETKVEEIQRMAEYAASLEDGEEHEVHEAYLRED
ncbi:diablo homolog, mitochondrial-like isoform X3 [Xiphias gladius]|uniref:diablo homolog, mitochondrial-like isoform X3 n=1 Tax=Xiphias gladius TaxID=8245 RepID=UPI001A995C18|nr:diablo homolog, mitochondrial-like isoform X3 [Xiphias gladius]